MCVGAGERVEGGGVLSNHPSNVSLGLREINSDQVVFDGSTNRKTVWFCCWGPRVLGSGALGGFCLNVLQPFFVLKKKRKGLQSTQLSCHMSHHDVSHVTCVVNVHMSIIIIIIIMVVVVVVGGGLGVGRPLLSHGLPRRLCHILIGRRLR